MILSTIFVILGGVSIEAALLHICDRYGAAVEANVAAGVFVALIFACGVLLVLALL